MADTLLLVGKIAFLLLLYLFIFSIVRSSTRDLRMAAPVSVDKRWRMPGAVAEGEEVAKGSATATTTMEGGVWILSVVKSPCIPVGAAYALPDDSHALAGRSSDMDIFLDDTFVSAKHALFEVTEEGFSVEDLRSTNGTLVNGTPIHGATLLEVGDRVSIGDTLFEVKVRQ
jgi:FHA domain